MISEASRQLISQARHCVIALSGGMDSVVLLDQVVKLNPPELRLLHINHQLMDEAESVAAFCVQLAERYELPIEVVRVAVSAKGSLEARAREARYAVFEQKLEIGDVLLQAHHADDQVETILLDLFRGSRRPGLNGMPSTRKLGVAQLHRPLLSNTRRELAEYARAQSLEWREDPTNLDKGIDRNFLRHTLLPVIDGRFPGARDALLSRAAGDERLRAEQLTQERSLLEREGSTFVSLDIDALKTLDDRGLLRRLDAWLQILAVPLMSAGCAREIIRCVRTDARVDIPVGGFVFRTHRRSLYVLRQFPAELPQDLIFKDGRSEFYGGYISNKKIKGGLRPGKTYRVELRQGGERFKQGVRRTLKNVFQSAGHPRWLRNRLPLIFCGDELVALAGLPEWNVPMLIADDWHARDDEMGHLIEVVFDEVLRASGETRG